MTKTSEQLKGTPLWLTQHNSGYWQVTIDDPPFNLFGPELLGGMEELVRRMQLESGLRVIVFESALSDYFIAHFDMVKGGEILARKTSSGLLPWFDVVVALYESPVISIASIRGRTRGVGIEFAAACDMRFASEKAIFGQFEVGVGTIPGGGSMEMLPLLTGRARALEIIIGAQDMNAATAERYGLINRFIPDDQLDEFVHQLALRISRFDPVITGQAKKMINQRAAKPLMDHLKASRAAFIEANLRPERNDITQKLKSWGIQSNPEFEYNLGAYLDYINEEGQSLQLSFLKPKVMKLAGQLVDSSFSAVINAPIEKINLPEWAFNLSEKEYQDCSPAHVSAAKTTGADGRRMSINVEVIGGNPMVQHYQEELSKPDHLVLASYSDIFTPTGRLTIHVQWELSIKRLSDTRCEFTNRVVSHATEEMIHTLERQAIPFELFKAQRQPVSIDHNRLETPFFAASIERAAYHS